MTTTLNMSLVLPTRGAMGSGLWDDALDAALTKLDAHTHATGDGVRITPAGLNINAALSMVGHSLTNIGGLVLAQSAASPGNNTIWRKTADDELYYTDSAARTIKITAAGVLNMSLVGGIGGDYAAASALVYYDDTAQAYRFLESSTTPPNSWSYIKAGGFDLYEHISGTSSFIGLRVPAGFAGSYSLTLPAALPAAQKLVQVAADGTLSFSNTLAAGQAIAHGDKTKTILPANALFDGAVSWDNTGGHYYAVAAGAGNLWIEVPFEVGDRIKTATVRIYGDASCVITTELIVAKADGTNVFASSPGDTPGGTWATSTAGVSLVYTLAAGDAVYAHVQFSATNGRARTISIIYDHPP